MMYAACKYDLQRMQPSVWETAKMSCTPPREKTLRAPKANFRQHRDDIIFGAHTQANLRTLQV